MRCLDWFSVIMEPKRRGTAVVVGKDQLKNPHVSLKALTYETQDKPPFDFLFSKQGTGILFLSLSYHYNHPLYIEGRLRELKTSTVMKETKLALLCVIVDRIDSDERICELQMCRFAFGVQLMLFKSGRQFSLLLKSIAE